MVGEFIYIFYSYVFGSYTVLLISMTAEHDHRCHQKDIFCLFMTCYSPRRAVRSHSLVCSKIYFDIVGIGPIRVKEL